MYESYEDLTSLYVVTEYIEGGELFGELKRRKKFNEQDCSCVIRQILEALCYCHANNLVHKDLKPENIMVDKQGDINRIKIVDFGTAQTFDKDKKMTEKAGTPYYVAPEVLNQSYNEKCDIWSAGVIMYIMLVGFPPFNGRSDDEILSAVKKGKLKFPSKYWKKHSKEAKDLISQMLVLNPDERISASEALEHPWMVTNTEETIPDEEVANVYYSLKRYKVYQKLQQAALCYIVTHMDAQEDIDGINSTFKALDANHDGKLSLEEIQNFLKRVKPEYDLDYAAQIFNEIDTSGNGFIDYTEWIAATIDKKKLLNERNLRTAFDAFDQDKSGAISKDNLKTVFGQGKNVPEDV